MTKDAFEHKYLPNIANVYGLPAALVYQHISWCSEKGRHRFVKRTVAQLAKLYPYLGTWQIRDALRVLTRNARNSPVILVANTEGRSWSYCPNCDYIEATPRNKVHVETACKFGITAGIIMGNFGYWIRTNWENRSQSIRDVLPPDTFDNVKQLEQFIYTFTKEHAFHHQRLSEWVEKMHPYVSLSSAHRAVAALKKAGLLEMTFGANKLPIWHLPKISMDNFIYNQLRKMELLSCPEIDSVRTTNTASKPQIACQNHKCDVKTTNEQDFTFSNTSTYSALIEAHVKEASVKETGSQKLTWSQPASRLANARRDSEVETQVGACPPDFVWELSRKEMKELIRRLPVEVAKLIEQLNKPYLPVPKKEVKLSEFGLPVKRGYTRKPVNAFDPNLPDEEQEFDRYYEERSGS